MCLEELCESYLTLHALPRLDVSPWNENACRNIRTACSLAEGHRALIEYGLASGLPRCFMSLQDIHCSDSSESCLALSGHQSEHCNLMLSSHLSCCPLLWLLQDSQILCQ